MYGATVKLAAVLIVFVLVFTSVTCTLYVYNASAC